MKPVAVVGGGITGLTAAFYLTRSGIPVTLYEKSSRTGGAIRSLLDRGFLTEDGPSQITETPQVASLVRDLHLETRRLYPSPDAKSRFIVKNGRLVAVPASPLGLISTTLFSASGKLRLLAEPFIKRADAAAEESVAAFVRRRLGQQLLDYAVDPLISGIYAGDPSRLSLRCAFPKLHELERASGSLTLGALASLFNRKQTELPASPEKKKARGRVLFSFDAGCQVLPDTLADELGPAIRLRTPVTALNKTAQGWDVTGAADGIEETNQHSALLLAAPAYELGSLAAAPAPFSLAPLKEIVYPPIARVTLGFREDQFPEPIRGFGFLVPSKEKFRVLGTVFASCVYPGRAPQGHVNLSSYLGGLRNPGIATYNPAELISATLADYRSLLGVQGEPVFASQTVIRSAIPQYTIGYGRYRDWMTEVEQASPGLFFAGNYRDGISVADSIASGVKAAQQITKLLNG